MKVWCVQMIDCGPLGVFTSEKKAQELCEACGDYHYVLELELDEISEQMRDHIEHAIYFTTNGK